MTKPPPLFGGSGGGIAPEIVGTVILVALAALIATPIGVLAALYVTEFAGARGARLIKTLLDLMQGLPTIIVAVLVFGLLVAGSGQSGLAASLALAIIMLPLISRSAQEVILLVPITLREASQALGMNRWRTITGVVLPYARRGHRHRYDPGDRARRRGNGAGADSLLDLQRLAVLAQSVPLKPCDPQHPG